MGKNRKAAGSSRERQLRDQLRNEGWVVYKGGGSLGPADLVCLKRGRQPMLIQSKANVGSPWKNFGRSERQLLYEEARQAGALAFLVHWPPHGRQAWLHSSEWPGPRRAEILNVAAKRAVA